MKPTIGMLLVIKGGWIMRFPRAFCVSVALLIGFGAVHGGETAKDWQKLKGNWEAAEIVADGKVASADEVKAVKVTFAAADKMTLVGGKDIGKHKFGVKLDASKKPKAIDLKALHGESKGDVVLGIYDLEGDTLKLCVSSDPKINDRPLAFASKQGSKVFMYTFKRAKP